MKTPVVLLVLLLAGCSSTKAASSAEQESFQDGVGFNSLSLLPENAAVIAGTDPVSFRCSSGDSSGSLNWVWIGLKGPWRETVLVSSCVVNPEYTHGYALENVSPGRCDLVVLNATTDAAGTYRCNQCDGFDPAHSGQLVVIDGGLICKLNVLEPHINDRVKLTCDISYTINISPIQIICTDSLGRVVASSTGTISAGKTTLSYTFIVLATYLVLPQYTCTARFSAAGRLPSSATNLPSLSFNWTSPSLPVMNWELWRPDNGWGYVGGSVTLICRRRTQQVIWTFVRYGRTYAITIVNGCNGGRTILAGYRIDVRYDAYLLIIDRLTLGHAGTYTCQDLLSNEVPVAAQLVVLDTTPQCSSSPSENVQPGDVVQLNCSVAYSGNYAPIVTWTDESGVVLASTTETTSTRVESRLSVTARDATHVITARTHFEEPSDDVEDDLSDYVESAGGAPDYTHSWSVALLSAGNPTTTKLPGDHETTTYNHITNLADCGDIKLDYPGAPSGVYSVLVRASNDAQSRVEVYCDMDTTGGGWTVFQRRKDGSVVFFNDWSTYQAGFGRRDGEFWIGNDNLAALTAQKQYTLRVDLGDWSDNRRYAQYNNFKVLGAADKYRLSALGNYSGDAGNSMTRPLGMMFSTFDADNDISDLDCATQSRGAWWYSNCLDSNLNGEYNNTASQQGVNWWHWLGDYYSLMFSEMKIRPSDFA